VSVAVRRLKPGEEPDPGAHVTEWDVTEGLREWVGEQIDSTQAAAAPGSAGERWCAAHRKILEAHPYTTRVVNPNYGKPGAPFGCETCHEWDGVPVGYGNCATILALAEGYGLDDH
jgi:hypothetical protein